MNPEPTPLDPTLELAKEFGEVGIDKILEDGLLKDIPIIGSIAGILRVISSTRDYLYYRKVRAFLEAAEKDIARSSHIPLEGRDDINKAGEACLLILDRMSDISKSALVGRLFAALVLQKLDYQSFHRLAEAVGDAYLEDLKDFMRDPSCSATDQREHLRSLSSVGFTRPFGDKTFGNLGIIYYEPTELSHRFLEALEIVCPPLTTHGVRNEDAEEPDLVGTFNNGFRNTKEGEQE